MLKLETERLFLEPVRLDDFDFIIRLVNSKGWLRFIGDRDVKTESEARNFIQTAFIDRYHHYGFGLLKIVLKTTQ